MGIILEIELVSHAENKKLLDKNMSNIMSNKG